MRTGWRHWFCLKILSCDFTKDMDVQAFAQGWAGAYTCKDTCLVEVDVVTEAVGSILATAAAEAYAGVCSGVILTFSPTQHEHRKQHTLAVL
jgi:hypothetical protein